MAVAGSFAYATRGALGLQAVDISRPDAPRPVGVITTPSLALSVVAADQMLYVTDAIFGLQVVGGGPARTSRIPMATALPTRKSWRRAPIPTIAGRIRSLPRRP